MLQVEFESLLALYKALLNNGRFMITPQLFPVSTNYIGLWKVLAGNNKTEEKTKENKSMENEQNSSFCPQILFIAFYLHQDYSPLVGESI